MSLGVQHHRIEWKGLLGGKDNLIRKSLDFRHRSQLKNKLW